MEERLCSCGGIQTEMHVVSHCPLSQNLRDEYEFTCITDLMSGRFENKVACKILFKVLKLYD